MLQWGLEACFYSLSALSNISTRNTVIIPECIWGDLISCVWPCRKSWEGEPQKDGSTLQGCGGGGVFHCTRATAGWSLSRGRQCADTSATGKLAFSSGVSLH